MIIKVYTDEDKSVVTFLQKVFKENNRVLDVYAKDMDLLDIKKNYMSDGCFWCLKKGNQIYGTIGLRRIEDYYEIRRFFIKKKYQSLGYGNKLLEIVFEYAIAHNIKNIKVATLDEYETAKHLFAKFGFQRIDRYHDSSANVFFECKLSKELVFDYKLNHLKKSSENTLILNPTESMPFLLHRYDTTIFEGLYISEHYKGENDKVIFGGRNEYIDFVNYIKDEWKTHLNAFDVDLKTLSGLNAHLIYFLCVLKPGDKVMLLPENSGGHFATGQILKNIGVCVYETITDYNNFCVDAEKTLEIIKREKINFLFIDRSEGLYYEDFSWVKQCDCYKIFDASQYLTSIICNEYKNPFSMGFDMIITTLHKNYPGPQKGLLAIRENDKYWADYLKESKTYISNTHPKGIIDSIIPLLNKDILFNNASISKSCVLLLEKELHRLKVPVILRNPNLIATHHIWILCKNKKSSFQFFLDLEAVGLLTNYRLLPYNLGFGLRVGIDTAVLCGLRENHIYKLAEIMAEVYEKSATDHLIKKTKEFIHQIKSIA